MVVSVTSRMKGSYIVLAQSKLEKFNMQKHFTKPNRPTDEESFNTQSDLYYSTMSL